MEIWEYLEVAPDDVLRVVPRRGYVEVIYQADGERYREKIDSEELVDVDATGGARQLAEEHGLDLADLYEGERLTYYDVKEAVDA